jgi:hypothetical protein
MAHPAVLIVLAIVGILLLAVVAHSIFLLITAAFCLAKVAILLAPVILVAFGIRWFVQRRRSR